MKPQTRRALGVVSVLVFSSCVSAFAAPGVNLSAIKGTIGQATLSPDGSRIAYARRTPQGWRIFVSRADGSQTKMITSGPKDDIEPSWRSDGAAIAFASNRTGNYDLFSVEPDGQTLKALTHTPTDERFPQWSPRPFGLFQPGDISSHTLAGRSRGNVAPDDLKLLEMLAKKSTSWDSYSYKFNIKPIVRYYKLLFTEGQGQNRHVATMRESGAYRQTLNPGMPGAYYNGVWDRSGASIAFLRQNAGTLAAYIADYPNTTDLTGGDPKPNFAIDYAEWRPSIHRVSPVSNGTQLSWTPNGEYIAAASGRELRLLSRPNSKIPVVVQPLSQTVAPYGFSWLGDGRTALLTFASSLKAVPVSAPLLDVINIHDFDDSLDAHDRTYLAKNSFVATGAPQRQMFHPYEETDYENLPIFITSDSLLHLNHLIFDYSLREVEKERLMPAVIALTGHYLNESLAQMKSDSPEIKNAATRNAAFFAVAARLAMGAVETGVIKEGPKASDADPLAADRAALQARTKNAENKRLQTLTVPLKASLTSLPPEVAKLADAEIVLIRGHKGLVQSPIFGGALTGVGQPSEPLLDTRIDYSDLIPRGHYTRSEVLRRYFLMSRWLADGPFRYDTDGSRRALLILAATDAHTKALLDHVLNVSSVFIGGADDGDIPSFSRLAQRTFNQMPTVALIQKEGSVQAFLEHVKTLPPPRIAPSRGSAFRVLPQPYTPDAEIMQSLIYDRNPPDVGTENEPRYFALGLDVMGVLGSKRARQILDVTKFQGSFFDFGLNETQYAHYDEQFNAQAERFDSWTETDWNATLYNRTLHALQPLLKPNPSPRYQFTRSQAWTDKNLNAALATWAELKHDTLPKQPVATEAGGEGGITEAPLWDQPRGFVEPAPQVFERLRTLVVAERTVLNSAGYLSPAIKQRLDTFEALLNMVAALERKQSAGIAFTPREVEQLRFYGAYQEHLTLITAAGEAGSMEGNDMAIIADVASAYSTVQKRLLALEEGVGRALPIYVAVERNGKRELACGAVFTYYEFAHSAEDRLTDEKWRTLLDSPQAPTMPSWTQSFVARLTDKQ